MIFRGLLRKPLFFCLVLLVCIVSPAMGSTAHAAVYDWQKGATFYPKSTEDYGSKKFRASVDKLDRLGATYVGLLVPYYQENTSSVVFERGWNTPSDKALAKGIGYIHDRGLKVFLIIHVDCKSQEWRADIAPYDRSLWFKNYGSLLHRYAEIGQKHSVELYSLGTELYSMTSNAVDASNDLHWTKLISEVRQRYHGKLTYGANHSTPSEKFEVNFWPLLDYIGVSAYYPLTESGATPQERLHNSWEKIRQEHIEPLTKYNKPIIFTELGYRSVSNSSHMPYAYDTQDQVDVIEQAQNYEAVFKYWDAYDYVAGWHVWAWEIDPEDGGFSDGKFTPQNKPAENILRKWYSQRRPVQSAAKSMPSDCTINNYYLGHLFKHNKAVYLPHMIAQDTWQSRIVTSHENNNIQVKLATVISTEYGRAGR